MILMRFLPGVLKEMSKHVPAVLFQTVEWNELAHELPKLSRRIIQKEGFKEFFDLQKEHLASHDIFLTQTPLIHKKLESDQLAAEKILTLYYAQIFSPHGVFLDLRSTHFQMENMKLKFYPSSFWTQFDEKFRLGLLKVYEGFFMEKDDLYWEGLQEIGLLRQEWPMEDKRELAELFRANFGEALSETMSFDLTQFKVSMIKMSEFMLNKKVTITKDFLYLGIYLVGMYSSLEETKAKIPVKSIYLKVKEHSL